MPSKNPCDDVEGFGIVYLEAGIFKKPVIASKFGGAKEAVLDGETGILVDEKNVEELKDKIELLLNDKDLRDKFGERAHDRIMKDFLWSKISKKLIENL